MPSTTVAKPKKESQPHVETLIKTLQKQVQELETEITRMKKEIDELEAELSKESVYSSPTELKKITQTLNQLKHDLVGKEGEYETVFEELLGLE
jgi:peptidoglycan hydrolase CwlO-like protein